MVLSWIIKTLYRKLIITHMMFFQRADGVSILFSENYDITKSKISPRLATIQYNGNSEESHIFYSTFRLLLSHHQEL